MWDHKQIGRDGGLSRTGKIRDKEERKNQLRVKLKTVGVRPSRKEYVIIRGRQRGSEKERRGDCQKI